MPIRINLLAEAQVAEEQRRKDPVKRAFLGAITLVSLAILWCMTIQVRLFSAKSELNTIAAKWKTIEGNYQVAVESQRQLIETENKLTALEQLRTNRFRWGSALNAFQQTLNGIDGIQVVRLHTEQTYTLQAAVEANKTGPVPVAAQPARSTEKISLSVEAKDSTSEPGNRQIAAFREAILKVPYFQDNLKQTNGIRLTSLSAPQTDGGKGIPFVKFTLQCDFPVKVR